MRPLTFHGFLESYVKYLSGGGGLALPHLVAALPAEPRLAEPLVLWAVATGRTDRLEPLLGDYPALVAELRDVASLDTAALLEAELQSGRSRLRPEYTKVWRSYVVRCDAPARDSRLKLDARARALELKAEKGVSQYRMAKDLVLNPGNLNAFLVQGDPRKLSLEKAYALVRYLMAA
jgi:hypothetical protein